GFSGTTGNGGSIVLGAGGTLPSGGFGGVGATPVGGTAGAQGGTSGVVGAGNTPGTGGTPPNNPCGALFKDCNGNPADGCETNTSDDAQNCGDCGVVCQPGANAAATCF